METVTSYFGTWEEIKRHEKEFTGHRMVVKVIKDPVVAERLARLERGLETIRRVGQGMGPYPDQPITNDVLYPDDEERA